MQRFDPRIRLPRFLNGFFPSAIWKGSAENNTIYLTFDDGPVPGVTPWVLDLLKREQIEACFFCVGENVRQYPDIYQRILDEGFQVGNHTYNHLQGIKTEDKLFIENIELAAQYIDSDFFRPPYGLMKKSQYELIAKDYQVVMWDIISGDYRSELTPDKVEKNVLKTVRPGSVIVFHDSYKAEKNLKGSLPDIIRKLKEMGYSFGKLTKNMQQVQKVV